MVRNKQSTKQLRNQNCKQNQFEIERQEFKGTVYVDNETLKYQYNQENGNFTSSYDEDQIKG